MMRYKKTKTLPERITINSNNISVDEGKCVHDPRVAEISIFIRDVETNELIYPIDLKYINYDASLHCVEIYVDDHLEVMLP